MVVFPNLSYIILGFCFHTTYHINAAEITELNDDQFADVINHNEFVIAFLQPEPCESLECHSALNELKLIADTTFLSNLKIVRLLNSNLQRSISSNSLPRILFYRKGTPILYDSDLIEHHDVVEWLELNKETSVHTLNSENFEHLTQAATGSTTGDWFVLFQSNDCLQITPIWEAVASRLKHRLNVATVDFESNPDLKTRFGINKCPTVRFFRSGKMYLFDLPMTEVGSFTNFAEGWYKNAASQSVPAQPSPFDLFVDKTVQWIKNNLTSQEMNVLVVGFVLLVAIVVLVVFCCVIESNRQTSKSKVN